ncbi:purine-nucleoside phosphorylase [Paratissierella segnis]|uniref:Purine nucleoside phosphorylase n=1 Tax=Paratissierella segnis TaxID=2763679 RepID=A0A926ENG0_9FIRM|nr:purine-nucleoside phosphorylase [Paratissierella segnis]MBC8586728.1 purine-nucleoside phosphorylase [Paratissierella segnis]
MKYNYGYFKESADYILSKIDFKPEIALILGSSLGTLSEEIENPVVIEYKDIPNFLMTTVESHAGKLILGELGGKKIVCMSGRFHYYEGYDFEQLVTPIRVFHLLGVEAVILTNAAGAVNTSYSPGEIMIIKDHIKLTGASPVRGLNITEFGPRFFDMSKAYTEEYRQLAKKVARDLGVKINEGVYFYCSGPQFESPAEIRAIRILGGDAVGMSTVTETITAAHCGMKVLGLSLITNMAAGILDQPLTTEEVDETAKEAANDFKVLMREIIKQM